MLTNSSCDCSDANNTDIWQTVANAWGQSNDAEGFEEHAEESAWELANPDVYTK
ncbi:MAG TPA: hypothetical protein VGO47_13790 [Chlamydiales bacterium]|nr:hypothetical protein [Chlamydiales bacterium]